MYTARITREHRSAFVILVDCSGSMNEEIWLYGERMTKKDGVTLIVNMFLEELINRSRREEGIADYFDICVIGYGDDKVSMLVSDEKHPFISVSELVAKRVHKRKFNITRQMPTGKSITLEVDQRCWVEPYAQGSTPMGQALAAAYKVIRNWCMSGKNRMSFPPSVINITDGEAGDADNEDLLNHAEHIKSLSTEDGATLFFNIHIAGSDDPAHMVSFPADWDELPGVKYARLLYQMSSSIPSCYDRMLAAYKNMATPPFRGVCYNCPPDQLFGMLKIGSASTGLMM